MIILHFLSGYLSACYLKGLLTSKFGVAYEADGLFLVLTIAGFLSLPALSWSLVKNRHTFKGHWKSWSWFGGKNENKA